MLFFFVTKLLYIKPNYLDTCIGLLQCPCRSTAVVTVAFTATSELRMLLEELALKPSPSRQWIGSEAWLTYQDLLKFSFRAGAIGFGIQKSVISGLREFLLDLSPTKVAASPFLTEFWEDVFNCRLGKSEKVVLIFNIADNHSGALVTALFS